jgi:hypothetical protein
VTLNLSNDHEGSMVSLKEATDQIKALLQQQYDFKLDGEMASIQQNFNRLENELAKSEHNLARLSRFFLEDVHRRFEVLSERQQGTDTSIAALADRYALVEQCAQLEQDHKNTKLANTTLVAGNQALRAELVQRQRNFELQSEVLERKVAFEQDAHRVTFEENKALNKKLGTSLVNLAAEQFKSDQLGKALESAKDANTALLKEKGKIQARITQAEGTLRLKNEEMDRKAIVQQLKNAQDAHRVIFEKNQALNKKLAETLFDQLGKDVNVAKGANVGPSKEHNPPLENVKSVQIEQLQKNLVKALEEENPLSHQKKEIQVFG